MYYNKFSLVLRVGAGVNDAIHVKVQVVEFDIIYIRLLRTGIDQDTVHFNWLRIKCIIISKTRLK